MKNIAYILATLFSISFVYAQSPDWFTDVSSETQIDQALGARVWIADVNGDGFPDLFTNEGKAIRNKLQLFINTQDPNSEDIHDRIFVNATTESGINNHFEHDGERYSDVAALADVDNDGDVDLVTSTYFHRISSFFVDEDSIEHGHYSEVLLNDGTGKFEIVPDHGLRDIEIYPNPIRGRDFPPYFANSTGISFLDYDNDGNLDMYFGTWFTHYNPQQGYNVKMIDLLFRGLGNGKFERVRDNAIDNVLEPMYGTNITDWNNDGWQDIITSPYCRSGGSIFMNNGDGTFSDATNQANYSAQHLGGDNGQNLCQWEAMPGDFDNDGDMDLIQVSVHGGYLDGEGRTTIAVNHGAESNYRYEWELDRLQRDADPSRTHVADMGAQWVDIDNDGFLDAMIGQLGYENASVRLNVDGQTRLYVMHQNEDGYFDDITKALGLFDSMRRVHSLEPMDFDLDGDLDLLFSKQIRVDGADQMQMTLLENNFANASNWIAVKLDAPENVNQSSIGARLYFHNENMVQMREIQAGAGHFGGQQPFIVHAGITDNNRLDSLVIRWPNKDLEHTTIHNPAINTIIEADNSGNYSPFIPDNANAPIIAFSKPYIKSDSLHPEGEDQLLSFQIINIGNSDLNINNFELSENFDGAFEILSDTENIVVLPGEEYSIEVKFDPSERFNYYTTIDFESNAYNGSNRSYDVYGIGYEASPLISAVNNHDFGTIFRTDRANTTIEINNPGELDLEITDLYLDENSEYFEIGNMPELPLTISVGEIYNLNLDFAPKGFDGEINSNLIIESNAYLNQEFKIALSGISVIPYANFAFSINSISFGSVKIGESLAETIEITNSGDTTLVITSIDFDDNTTDIKLYPKDQSDSEFPYIVEIGETKEFSVEFEPSKKGFLSTEMILNSNDPEYDNKRLKVSGLGLEVSSVLIALDGSNEMATIYPNPATDEIMLSLQQNTLPQGNYQIYAVNSMGQRLKLDFITIFNHTDLEINMNVDELSNGYYQLVISGERNTLSIPFIIAK